MSHFSVLVIGPNPEDQLAPYHEYECTGRDDQYVIDVDVTDELNTQLQSEAQVVKMPDGTLISRYDDRFYTKEPDDGVPRALRRKEFELPSGCEIMAITRDELRIIEGESVQTFAKDYGGWFERTGRYYDRTNPNSKWDWYQLGGRWSGWLKLKAGASGTLGDRSLLDDEPDERAGFADMLRKVDIDFEGMMNDAGEKAGKEWDESRALSGGEVWLPWKFFHDQMEIAKAREAYHAQPALAKLNVSETFKFRMSLDDLLKPRDVFVKDARNGSFIPYAIVQDSKWFAKGEMGWWGCSDDSMTQEEWNQKATELLLGLPDDTLITVVDCHI